MSHKVLVDADIWSEFFRKRQGEPSPQVVILRELITSQRVLLIDVVRQEALCGWRYQHQFERICQALREFDAPPLPSHIYETAAEYYNLCRSKGIQGSNTDFLLCACSAAWDVPVLTKDGDFARYAQLVSVRVAAI